MTPPRYAAGTEVSVEKSRAEIETLLRKHGATSFVCGWDDEQAMSVLVFRLVERHFRLEVRKVDGQNVPAAKIANVAVAHRKARIESWVAGEERRSWRALLLIVKAKLEMIANGGSSAEREFLADMLLPNGETVATAILPGIAKSYASGEMPRRLLPALSGGK